MSVSKFSPSELRHYAKRADLYALDETKEKLRDIAWKLSNNKDIKEKSETALKRIAEIPNLDKTCINQDCEKCKKLIDEFEVSHTSTAWGLNVELYRWQKEAKRAWGDNGGKGILKVVTGAGKTIFALSVMKQIHDRYDGENIKFVIIVPSTALLDQWLEELENMLNIDQDDIGLYYGEQKDNIEDKDVVIYVINSARDALAEDIEKVNSDVFLTVPYNILCLRNKFRKIK